MIQRQVLHHPQGETPILSGDGVLGRAADELSAWLGGRQVFVVTTPRVLGLHGADLDLVRASAKAVKVFEVDEGEAAKTISTAERLWRQMLEVGGKRDSRIIGFGGGSVCDLAGFVGGCFLRGIEVAQFPTTLLAQVDAAIGGKTGVDLPAAKNSVGLFHHPTLVLSESRWLSTLPAEELRAGLMEVIKVGALLDVDLFERVEEDRADLLAGVPAALAPTVAAAAGAKVAVVERDPLEADERRLLNFGHTLGHALESRAGYSGLRHGEAVGYGMLFATLLAEDRGWADDLGPRLRRLIETCELPQLAPLLGLDSASDPSSAEVGRVVQALTAIMARDKKARESGLVWVLPERLGRGRMVSDVDAEAVSERVKRFLFLPLSN